MWIRMISNFPVAPNGWDTTIWPIGKVEDVSEQLASDLIQDAKVAEASEPPAVADDDGEDTPKRRRRA